MQETLKEYITKIDNLLKQDKVKNKDEIIEEHLIQIKFFQHERLVHLIVTVFVGIISVLFFLAGLIQTEASLLLLFILTIILFTAYIFHYYFLENGIQKLYKQFWQLKEKENTRN